MTISHEQIRNFCIIAHVDHGKSTLADRLLEHTGTVSHREMKEQLLDQMDLERERGITIKLQPVRIEYKGHILNLIDTPGHADFSYEVSRSLAAVEGALLIVDATQGIEAQTLANLHLAREHGLVIIPIINKIDLPSADIQGVTKDLSRLLDCDPDEVLLVSAKTGLGIDSVLEAIVQRVPHPSAGIEDAQALIFDSVYDEYQGVIAYIRMMSGSLRVGERFLLCAAGAQSSAIELGYFKPARVKSDRLLPGEIGYIVTGLKSLEAVRVGDTITGAAHPAAPVPGYREVKPVVYAGFFPKDGDAFDHLRDALGKLKLNDASLSIEPESSEALGFGFRCGLLGLLHLEIVRERLRREYNLDVLVTNPSVAYIAVLTTGEEVVVRHPSQLPDQSRITLVREPMMRVEIVTPSRFIGNVMQLAGESHGRYLTTEYLEGDRVVLSYRVPLSSLLVDFYDRLKGGTSGYASFNYEFDGYEEGDLVRMDILLAGEPVDALAVMVYRPEAQRIGGLLALKLKELLPRQQFEVKIQAAIGSRIVASERIPALRKDVLAKMSGGDATRKMKLLKKQKEGKKRMRNTGRIDIPSSAFMAMLRMGR